MPSSISDSTTSSVITNLSYLPFALLLFQTLGFGKTLPWGVLPLGFGHWIWLLASLFMVGLLFNLNRQGSSRVFEKLEGRLALRVWVFFNLIYLGFTFFKFRDLGFRFPWIGLILIIIAGIFADPRKPVRSILFNSSFLVASIFDYPVDLFRSDMIPAVSEALRNWSESGNPYLPGISQGHPVSYGYLPGIFISHLPAWFLGIDLRWNSFLYRCLWLVMLHHLVMKSKRKDAALAFQYLAFSPYLNFRSDLYFESYLFLLVAFFQSAPWRFVALPLMIITSQWSWLLSPFLLLNDWFQNRKDRLHLLLKYLAGGAATLTLLALILWDRDAWPQMIKTVFWFQKVVGDPNFPFDYGLNLKFLFLKSGILGWMQKVQFLVFLILLSVSVLTKGNREGILQWALVSSVLFIMLNGHYWLYFWNPVIVFSVILLALRGTKLCGPLKGF